MEIKAVLSENPDDLRGRKDVGGEEGGGVGVLGDEGGKNLL